jgi:hypothetical protein
MDETLMKLGKQTNKQWSCTLFGDEKAGLRRLYQASTH